MSFNHTLSAILRGSWLIDKAWADAHLPLVLNMLNGVPVTFESSEKNASATGGRPYVLDPNTMERTEGFIYDWERGRFIVNPNIPKNSVGVIPITGPITKYNGSCGEPGAIERYNWFERFKHSTHITSIVMVMDTPGGESRAAKVSVDGIQKAGKPVLAYCEGYTASLGMWMAAAADEFYASDALDGIGSIGSYATILDYSGFLEKNGIKIHEIYAPQSTEKNASYREAINGNYQLLQDELKMHVDRFISFVKEQRGEKSAASVKEWSTGKLFHAEDAVNVGLADGIRSFEQVVSKASWLAKRKR